MKLRNIEGNEVPIKEGVEFSWRPAVYGFLVKDDKLLCIKPAWDDKFALPGGAMEFEETQIESLKREFLEETGYRVEVIGDDQPLLFKTALFVTPISKKYFQSLIFFFKVRLVSEVQEDCKEIGKETEKLCWKNINEINLDEFTLFQRDFLEKMLKEF